MSDETIAQALEREHREIDGGIEAYLGALGAEATDPAPLLRALQALRRHIYLEEQFLFPPLREAGMMAPIFVMLREHGELWQAMDALEGLVGETAAPGTLAESCRGLLALLDNHNSKEEPIIYPQADAALSPELTTMLHEFLATGQMPVAWVCSAARPR